MDVKEFAVSVQWGKGLHYFSVQFDSEREAKHRAQKMAISFFEKYYKQKRKGAKPKLFVWQQVHWRQPVTEEAKA